MVAGAVLAIPGVRALSPGPGGEAATYGNAERVVGVRLLTGERGVTAEVRVALGTAAVRDTAQRIIDAAAAAARHAGQPLADVTVYVDEVRLE